MFFHSNKPPLSFLSSYWHIWGLLIPYPAFDKEVEAGPRSWFKDDTVAGGHQPKVGPALTVGPKKPLPLVARLALK